MTSVIQPTFAAGELSPSARARVDIARYYTGLRLCRNFTVMPYGGVRNRPGTRFVCELKDSSKTGRLLPFQFNDEQTYVLVFGDETMRVVMDGGEVLYSSGPNAGQPFELVTPYGVEDLALLNYTQSADVMTFAHPKYKPRDLSRLGHDNWTIAEISLAPKIAAPASATATSAGGSGVAQTWRYQVTAVLDDGSIIDESLPATTGNVTVNADTLQATVTWAAVAGASYYIVYKDNAGAGIYGFIGRASGLTFTDKNTTPIKTDTPPNTNDPFVGAGNYPGAVGYYQQRLTFAGSDNNPQTVWMSRTGLFKNFGYSVPSKDDDAITFTIASKEVNRMRHLLGLRSLLGLTSGGEWTFNGGSDTGLTAKTIQANQEGYDGSSTVQPVVVGSSAVYVQARGNRVSSFGYSLEADGFTSGDLTLFSAHLFKGRELVQVAYQKVPDSIVWYLRDDGVLLGMTYLPEQQLVAWHHHDTDGVIESIACVPEGQEDALYLLVRRQINGQTRRYVERMETRQILTIEDAFFVDSGLTYDGRNTSDSQSLTLSGGTDWKYPEVVTMMANGFAPFTAGMEGVRYALRTTYEDADENPVTEVVRVEITEVVSSTVANVQLQIICPDSLRDVPVIDWARQVRSVVGLDHLEGTTVSVLADGNVHPQAVVTDGAITLQSPAGVVHVGLPYVADMETLDLELQGANETLLDKKLAVMRLIVQVEESRGIFAGKDKAHLYEHKASRSSYELPLEMLTGQAEIEISNDWETKGRIFIRQSDPLPLTVLAVIPDVVIGGR